MLVNHFANVALWCNGLHNWATSFNKVWTHIRRRFKSCSGHVGDLSLLESLTMVTTGNMASLVNHSAKKRKSPSIYHFSTFSICLQVFTYFDILIVAQQLPWIVEACRFSNNMFPLQLLSCKFYKSFYLEQLF